MTLREAADDETPIDEQWWLSTFRGHYIRLDDHFDLVLCDGRVILESEYCADGDSVFCERELPTQTRGDLRLLLVELGRGDLL